MTANSFHGIIEASRGPEAAASELERAAAVIREALRKWGVAGTSEDVERYLASPYGAHTARDVLKKTPVHSQLINRKARFLRHFQQVRQGATL